MSVRMPLQTTAGRRVTVGPFTTVSGARRLAEGIDR